MSALELKLPPVLVTILLAVTMWPASRLGAEVPAAVGYRLTLLAICLAAATVVGLAAVVSFRRAKTTVNPLTPEQSSALVEAGIFRHTRNPMYLALLLALVGWGLFLASFYSLLLAGLFVPYMNRFQILPEERALESAFGEDFLAYKHRVRRWL